jgi:hypothetical protein
MGYNDYGGIDLGTSMTDFWYKPSPMDLPFPPLTWVKPVTQRAILAKCDQEVAYRKERMKNTWSLCQPEFEETKEAWRKAMIQRHWCRMDLELAKK